MSMTDVDRFTLLNKVHVEKYDETADTRFTLLSKHNSFSHSFFYTHIQSFLYTIGP